MCRRAQKVVSGGTAPLPIAAVQSGAPCSSFLIVVLPAPTSAAISEEPRHRAVARYLWAMLLARIYEALPLSCPICHSQMRIIAFINDASTVKKILDHIGECTQSPRIAPAREPPLWGWLRQRNRRRTINNGIKPLSLDRG